MKRIVLALCLSGVLAALASLAAPANAQTPTTPASSCDSLANAALPHATITSATLVSAGAFRPAVGTDEEKAWADKTFGSLAPFCRVAATLTPSSDSDIRIEVWLPPGGWNGKFQGIGNGGFGGTIDYAALADAVAHGYAAAASDTGHANPDATDAAWALHHPEKIVDFGHRAIHEMTVAGKAIARQFYGAAPRHAYFSSCSNGGRQALMEAQRYPEDYDGIIAGAPAYNWTGLFGLAGLAAKTLSDPAGYIPSSKLPAIEAASLAACDLNDRVKDGVIENPAACRLDAAGLLCDGTETDACLTAPQVATLRTLYAGLEDEHTPMPGYSPGAEAGPGGWRLWITGPKLESSWLFLFMTNFYKYMVFDDPAWDYRTFDAERDVRAGVEEVGAIVDATNADLTAFRARGGKLILYHGWTDAAIPAAGTIDYYERVVEHAGEKASDEFVRLYMAPGMQHCGGGPGPNTFGIMGVPRGQPTHDIAAALEAWVERGTAPGSIIASKVKDGAVVRTRPLCPYPQIAIYKGIGSTDDAANFACGLSR